MGKKIKYYSNNAISIATYLGGPLAAGILIRKNFLNLGKEKEGLIALIVGVVSTILLFWGIFQIPEHIIDKIPNPLIPLVYTGIICLIVEKMHGNILRKHKAEKNEFYSNWRATGVGLICMVILLGGIFAYAYYAPEDWDTKTYNSELKKYKSNEKEIFELSNILDTNSKHEFVQFLEQTGIPKSKENIEILNKMSNIENIPEEYQKQNKLLFESNKLCLEVYELTLKYLLDEISESEFIDETTRKNARLNEIPEELSKIKLTP